MVAEEIPGHEPCESYIRPKGKQIIPDELEDPPSVACRLHVTWSLCKVAEDGELQLAHCATIPPAKNFLNEGQRFWQERTYQTSNRNSPLVVRSQDLPRDEGSGLPDGNAALSGIEILNAGKQLIEQTTPHVGAKQRRNLAKGVVLSMPTSAYVTPSIVLHLKLT
jgi:hypothetical protein